MLFATSSLRVRASALIADPHAEEVEALLSLDPFGFEAGDPNLYRYVGNGPTNATDPSGLKIALIADGCGGNQLFIHIPDSYKGTTQDYIKANYPQSPCGYDNYEARMTPEQQAIVNAAKGNEAAEKELVLLLNRALSTHVAPSLPVLGYFWPDTFGSHCVRWTNKLEQGLYGLPADKFGKNVIIRQYTLRYPRRGGPEHSIILVKIKGKDVVVGIDNGALGGDSHVFDPTTVIGNTSLPQETRDDLEDALKQFRGR